MRKLLLAAVIALLAGCAGNPFLGYDIAPGTPEVPISIAAQAQTRTTGRQGMLPTRRPYPKCSRCRRRWKTSSRPA